jgi:hypothetical protein
MYEATVANRLQQRNSYIPGYNHSMLRAIEQYEYWFLSRHVEREREREIA